MIKKRRGNFRLGSVFGIEIDLHYTWFIILGLLVWGLSTGFFPVYYPEFSTATAWILGAVSAVLLFASVLLHELSHSIVAKKSKMKVSKITLFFFGGVAQISEGGLTPKKEFRMAIAGPLFSLALGFLFLILYNLSNLIYIAAISKYLYIINFIIAGFNMVPGFPLDGGRILRSILWYFYKDIKKATRIAAYAGKVFAIFLIVFGFLGFFGLIIKIGEIYIGGLWFIIIGFFLYYIAGASYNQIILKELLSKVQINEIVLAKPIAIDEDITIAELFSKFLKLRKTGFLVKKGKKFTGIVSVRNLKQVQKKEWSKAKVSDIMVKHIKSISPNDDLFKALRIMLANGLDILPVKKNEKISGVLTKESIIRYIKIKNQL